MSEPFALALWGRVFREWGQSSRFCGLIYERRLWEGENWIGSGNTLGHLDEHEYDDTNEFLREKDFSLGISVCIVSSEFEIVSSIISLLL